MLPLILLLVSVLLVDGQAPVVPSASSECRDATTDMYTDDVLMDAYMSYILQWATECSDTEIDTDTNEYTVRTLDDCEAEDVYEEDCESADGGLCFYHVESTVSLGEVVYSYDITMAFCYPTACADDLDELKEHYENQAKLSYGNSAQEWKFSFTCPFVEGEPCFSLDSTLMTRDGPIRLADISSGTEVLSVNSANVLEYNDLWALFHLNRNKAARFLQMGYSKVGEEEQNFIEMTPNHFVYRSTVSNSSLEFAVPVEAREVQLGDFLWVRDTQCHIGRNDCFTPLEVLRIRPIVKTGYVSPHTLNGNVVVDGVLASSYGSVPGLSTHSEVHSSLRVVRAIYPIFGSLQSKIAETLSSSESVVSAVYGLLDQVSV